MANIVNDPYLLQAFYTKLDTTFYNAVLAARPMSWADRLAIKAPSTSRATRHAWLTQFGPLVEYVGEKPVERLSTRGYVIENKKYGKAYEIPEEDFEDDQLGMWGNAAALLGNQAAKWPDDLLVTLLKRGKTELAYDGQPFFNGSHPVNMDNAGAGTFSNLLTGTPLTADNFGAVLTAFSHIRMENGRILPIQPVLTVVDPTNTIPLARILNSTIAPQPLAAGVGPGGVVPGNNILQGATQALTIPELIDEPGVWYMLATLGGIRPLMYQVRKEPQTIPLTDAAAANMAWHDKMTWVVKARGNAGFTFPFLMIRCEPT
jgi:phage major head subunit gpT-like protein